MGKNFSNAKTSADDGDKWEDGLPFKMVDIRQAAKNTLLPIRLVGYIEPFMRFWVPTEADKAYDPYKTKCKMYPSICVDFDAETEEFSGNDCLYRKANYKYVDPESGESRWGKLKPTKNYLIFFIDRERQDERTGITLKKKVQEAITHSDIQCATVPTAFAKAIQTVIELKTKKNKGKSVDPTDPEAGYDIFFKFDPDAKAEAKYTAQLGDDSPLSKEELRQLKALPDSVSIYPKDSAEKIAASLDRHGYVIVEPGDNPADVQAAAKAGKAGKGKKSDSKSTMRAGAELIEDDDNFEDEDGDLTNKTEAESTPQAEPIVVAADDDDGFGDFDDEAETSPKTEAKAEVKKADKPEAKKEEKDEFDDWDDDD